ncbi:MAG: ATP-binding protein [bacterium]
MKLRIRPRMMGGFLVMSCLLILLCVFTILYTNRMLRNTHRILDENVSSQKAAEELEIALLDMKGFTSYYLLDGDPKWLELFSSKKSIFNQWFDEARIRTHTDDERIIADEIFKLFNKYIELQKKVVLLYQEGKVESAATLLKRDMRNAFDLIYEKCEAMLTINEEFMLNSSRLVERDNRAVNRIMVGIGIVGILCGLGLGFFLTRSITHPIYELVLKVKGVTEGEIVEKVDIDKETELEHLDKYVRNLIDKVHETNKDFQRSQQMLIRSEKLAALGKIAAGLAHEIRNPLTAIKMLIYSLHKEAKTDARTEKDYEVIFKEINRMEKFIQNFLDFARPPNPTYGLTDINESITHTLNLLAPQIKNKKVKLIKTLEAKDAHIHADKEQIQQVLVNIILNALQSMDNNGMIELNTRIHVNPSDKLQYLQIRIKDTGTGIPIEILDTIFDPLVTGKEDGTGLGLSIAHQIIRNHNGWIEAMNNRNRGAIFIINLPFTRGQHATKNTGCR